MKAEHTPGPWKQNGNSIIAPGKLFGRTVSIIPDGDGSDDETPEGIANARLIAAAPELLQALRQLDAWFKSGVVVQNEGKPIIAHSWVHAAISRATGN